MQINLSVLQEFYAVNYKGNNIMKVKFGVVGLGNMGSYHCTAIEELPNAELTAVCDIDPDAFGRIPPALLAKVQRFDTAAELCSKADVDVIVVAVPHYSHPDIAINAMECGKHVIVEKPIAVHKAEAERLLATAAKFPDLVKSAMFNQRTCPEHRKIKDLIDKGALGRINRVNWIITNWFRTQSYYDSGDWRASWRGEGGGVLLNQCPHQLDLMQWFFGMPSKVMAHVHFGKYHDIEVEDEVTAYLEYPNGATGCFITTTGEAPGTNRLEIAAEKGRLVFENNKILFTRNEEDVSEFIRTADLAYSGPAVWNCEIPVGKVEPVQHKAVLANVANVIQGKEEKLIAPLEEGIRGLELGNAMMLSGWLNEMVSLPVDGKVYAEKLAALAATSRYQCKKRTKLTGHDFGSSF